MYNNIINFGGQAEQDKFVLNITNFKKNGYFLELGSGQPCGGGNNTYCLEKEFDWRGISIDKEGNKQEALDYKNKRPNSIYYKANALSLNYIDILKNSPKNIDYLQIDLHVDDNSTLNLLLKMDKEILDKYKFATITFEHDYYMSKNNNDIWSITRKISREIFKKRGYVLIFPDVQLPSNTYHLGIQCGKFEDWYVHPELVDKDIIEKYKTDKSLFFKDIKYN